MWYVRKDRFCNVKYSPLNQVSYVLFVSPEGDKLSTQSLQRLEREGRVIALETVKHVMGKWVKLMQLNRP